jgi:hypothetical protein
MKGSSRGAAPLMRPAAQQQQQQQQQQQRRHRRASGSVQLAAAAAQGKRRSQTAAGPHAGLAIAGGAPKGTSSSLFHEQSTTARPLFRMRSASSRDTLRVPAGLRMTPGNTWPSRSSST